MSFTLHTKKTAPPESRPILENVEQAFGFIPNMLAVLSESPLALSAYTTVTGLIEEKARLAPQEQQVVMLTVSQENGCGYCGAAHSKLAEMNKVPADVIKDIQEGKEPSDAKLAVLSRVTRELIKKRGWIDENTIDEFLNAGYDKAHLLDVLTIIALKTISNYANHIAETPVDPGFK